MARDAEGEHSDIKGIELAESVFDQYGQKTVLFTGRFDPTTFPHASAEERIRLAQTVQRCVFGRTNRYEEPLHPILHVLRRQRF